MLHICVSFSLVPKLHVGTKIFAKFNLAEKEAFPSKHWNEKGV